MAQNIELMGATYSAVPSVQLPKSGGGLASFDDTTDANATAGEILDGKTAYVNGAKVTGTIPSQAAQTITPTTSNIVIPSGKYLTGAQTILGDANLIPANIASGVSIFGVNGTHSGGGGWTKLYEWEITASTTSTSATTVATKSNLSNFSRSPNCLYYAVVKDKAGIRKGYFYANVSVMFDLNKWLGYGVMSALVPVNMYCFSSSNGTSLSGYNASNGMYGVYVGTTAGSLGQTGPTLTIDTRYSSSLSKTINGTYVVQVYQITLPSGATPFPT